MFRVGRNRLRCHNVGRQGKNSLHVEGFQWRDGSSEGTEKVVAHISEKQDGSTLYMNCNLEEKIGKGVVDVGVEEGGIDNWGFIMEVVEVLSPIASAPEDSSRIRILEALQSTQFNIDTLDSSIKEISYCRTILKMEMTHVVEGDVFEKNACTDVGRRFECESDAIQKNCY